jgi:hypothetical protein
VVGFEPKLRCLTGFSSGSSLLGGSAHSGHSGVPLVAPQQLEVALRKILLQSMLIKGLTPMAGRWLSTGRLNIEVLSMSLIDGSLRISEGSASTICLPPIMPLSVDGRFAVFAAIALVIA